jgi:hypothetical protein
MSQASFQKQQREKARRERAAAKFARKQERRENRPADAAPIADSDEAALLTQLAALHARFDAEEITFEEFEDAKAALTERLDIR